MRMNSNFPIKLKSQMTKWHHQRKQKRDLEKNKSLNSKIIPRAGHMPPGTVPYTETQAKTRQTKIPVHLEFTF